MKPSISKLNNRIKKLDWPPVLKSGQTYIRIVDSPATGIVMLLLFFLVASAWIVNLNSRSVSSPHDGDEWHTLVIGTQYLSPVAESVPSARVGETNRWFVRLLHPVGLYYMNSHMGGEHYETGWDYAGGYYLREHFRQMDAVRHDPNVQDYVYSMRVSFGVVAVFSFCMVIWVLFRRFGAAASATYASLVLVNPIVFSQFDEFYSETTLFILFNTAAFLCLRARPSTTYLPLVLWGLLSAAALSTKLTGALIAVPLFVHVVVHALRSRRDVGVDVVIYLLSAAIAFGVLNMYSESIFSLLNETLANVYHFKTGHLVTAEGGVQFIQYMLDDLGHVLPILFVVSLLWLARRPRMRLAPIYILGLLLVVVSWNLLNSAVYSSRNMASVYVAMSLVVALGAGSIVESIRSKHKYVAAACCWLVVALMASELVRHQYQMPALEDTFFERNVEQMNRCSTIGAVGLSKPALPTLSFSWDGYVTVLDRVEGPFNISENPGVFDEYVQYDCLIVHRQGQSKQISNFVAPRHYQLSDRVGNLFFFSREPRDKTASGGDRVSGLLPSGRPIISSDWDVYLVENSLIFAKDDQCSAEAEPLFFVHLYPVDINDLPGHRQQHGFGGFNFSLDSTNVLLDGGVCVAKVELPDYAIAAIRTGQFTDEGQNIWEGSFDVVESADEGNADPAGSAQR